MYINIHCYTKLISYRLPSCLLKVNECDNELKKNQNNITENNIQNVENINGEDCSNDSANIVNNIYDENKCTKKKK